MVNFMRVGSGNITDRVPKHNGLMSSGGFVYPTRQPVNQPTMAPSGNGNPRLPSQAEAAAYVTSRVNSILNRAR